MPLSDSLVLSSSYPMPEVPPGSIIDLIYDKFDSFPEDKVAVLDDASGRSFSFRDLKRLTGQVASGLAKRGFGKGQVLSLVSTNCAEIVPIAHGAIAAGGTLHLVKPLASQEELRSLFGLARPRIIVTTAADAVLEAVRAIALDVQDIYAIDAAVEGCRRAEELLEDPGDANPWGRVDIDPREDVAVMMLTGGTTKMSKTVLTTHDAFKQGVLTCPGLTSKTEHQEMSLGYIPFSHSYSFTVIYGSWLRLGCGIVNVNSYDPKALLKAIEKHRISQVASTPAVIMSIIDCDHFKEADLSSMGRLLCAGACMTGTTEEYLDKAIRPKCPNIEFNQIYGMTEMVGPVCNPPPFTDKQKYKRKFGSSGLLYPSFELRVISCDGQNNPRKAGELGEIRLRQTRFTKGYLMNDEENRKAIDDGWYCTGDYGYFDEDEYVFIVDRLEDLIRHKDGLFSPTNVESVLRTHPGIKDCAVIGRRSEKGGEEAVAFVVRREGCDVTAEEVRRFGAERLAPREQLAGGVRFVESIPKSPIGKMLRRALWEQQPMWKASSARIPASRTAMSLAGAVRRAERRRWPSWCGGKAVTSLRRRCGASERSGWRLTSSWRAAFASWRAFRSRQPERCCVAAS